MQIKDVMVALTGSQAFTNMKPELAKIVEEALNDCVAAIEAADMGINPIEKMMVGFLLGTIVKTVDAKLDAVIAHGNPATAAVSVAQDAASAAQSAASVAQSHAASAESSATSAAASAAAAAKAPATA